jgi:hypothetical protein
VEDPSISVKLDIPLSTVGRELSAVDEGKVTSADTNGVTAPECPFAGSIDDPGISVEVYEACGIAA